MASIRIEEIKLDGITLSGRRRLYWFQWSAPRAANYELTLRLDFANCNNPLRMLDKGMYDFCDKVHVDVMTIPLIVDYKEGTEKFSYQPADLQELTRYYHSTSSVLMQH